ncbi:MAG: inorganic diphosphatase [Bacilli bacterium]|nr:inorganic diphosphatase [Bacilli bacterium]
MSNIVDAIIEIPLGTKNKYELDKNINKIRLSRVQYSSMTYPSEYGYIDETLAGDGDPVDILVISSEATFPGCVVEAKVLGYLDTIDGGHQDPKIIAVNNVDPRCNFYNKLSDLPKHSLVEIKNFFQNYKLLQNIKVEVFDYHDINDAMQIINDGKLNYQKEKNNL